jgi:hypothetical protein
MSVQNLTTTTMGNASVSLTSQRPLNLLSGRECTFARQIYENDSTATMMRTCKQEGKDAIGAVL